MTGLDDFIYIYIVEVVFFSSYNGYYMVLVGKILLNPQMLSQL